MARRRKANKPAYDHGDCARCGRPLGDQDWIVTADKTALHDRHDDDCATQHHQEQLTNG